MDFEITVQGVLSERIASRFENLEVETGDGITTLHGTGPDSGLLHGVMAQLQDLGIEIVTISTVEAPEPK